MRAFFDAMRSSRALQVALGPSGLAPRCHAFAAMPEPAFAQQLPSSPQPSPRFRRAGRDFLGTTFQSRKRPAQRRPFDSSSGSKTVAGLGPRPLGSLAGGQASGHVAFGRINPIGELARLLDGDYISIPDIVYSEEIAEPASLVSEEAPPRAGLAARAEVRSHGLRKSLNLKG